MREQASEFRERRLAAVGASWTAVWASPWGRGLVISTAVGAFLAVAGAFHTGAAPLGPRLAYWVGLMAVGTACSIGAENRVLPHPGPGPPALGPAGHDGAHPVAAVSGVIWLSVAFLFGVPFDRLVAAGPGFLAQVFAYTLVVGTGMAGLHLLASRRLVETHARAPGTAPARFLERLPAKLRGADLYAVEAEDHYLRLHTSRGSDLILMRLSDAVAELEGIEGAQTHRSWWVARAGVADARRGDGRAVLTLKDGAEAPVSRTHAAALRRAGWF